MHNPRSSNATPPEAKQNLGGQSLFLSTLFGAKQADRHFTGSDGAPAQAPCKHLNYLYDLEHSTFVPRRSPVRWHDPGNFRQERSLGIMEQWRRDVRIGEAEWCFP